MASSEPTNLANMDALTVAEEPLTKSTAKNGDACNFIKPAHRKRNLKKKAHRESSGIVATISVSDRLHNDMWFNMPLMGNEGAECRCPANLRNHGPHHSRFVLEDKQKMWPSCRRNLSQPTIKAESAKDLLKYAVACSSSIPLNELARDVTKSMQQCDGQCSLFHYILHISPGTNYVSDCARRTSIVGPGGNRFTFEGFLVFSHEDLSGFPAPVIILFGYQYTLTLKPFDFGRAVCCGDHQHASSDAHDVVKLDMLTKYLTSNLLELHDWNLQPSKVSNDCDVSFPVTGASDQPFTNCDFMHFMPCFRDTTSSRVLSVQQILEYCAKNYRPVITENFNNEVNAPDAVEKIETPSNSEPKVQLSTSTVVPLTELRKSRSLQNEFQQLLRGAIVHNPGAHPAAVRVDQVEVELTAEERAEFEKNNNNSLVKPAEDADKNTSSQQISPSNHNNYPVIIHFGHKPAHLACCGNPAYLNIYKKYQRIIHLNHQNKSQCGADIEQREALREKLLEMRKDGKLKREVKCMLSAKNFYYTGLSSDVMQQALLLPVITFHYRYQRSLAALETLFEHEFKNRQLLQLALTHPSFRMTYGTNADHVRNSLTNCGARHMQYGPMHDQYQRAARKSGITTQTDIMSRLGADSEQQSKVLNYERLEFLGDAVLEFLVSRRLYHLFPDFQEGVLATYRSALVDNAHLGFVAEHLGFRDFLLIGHGTDLCSEMDMRHTLANCFEACIGALFLDSGGDLEKADKFIAKGLFCYADDTENAESTSSTSDAENLCTLQKTWLNNTRYHEFAVDDPQGDRYWLQKAPMLQHLIGFEQRVGFTFHRIRLLAKAFILKSSATAVCAPASTSAESESSSAPVSRITLMPSTIPQIICGNNERLEFLGDAVLQLMVSEHLYKYYPSHHEGHLSLLRSSLVSNNTLAFVCDELEMEKYQQLLLGSTLPPPAKTSSTVSVNGASGCSSEKSTLSSIQSNASETKVNLDSLKMENAENTGKKRSRRQISLEPGELSSSSNDSDGDKKRYSPPQRRRRCNNDNRNSKEPIACKRTNESENKNGSFLTATLKLVDGMTDNSKARREAGTPPSPTDPVKNVSSLQAVVGIETNAEDHHQTSVDQVKPVGDSAAAAIQQQRRSKYKADLVEAFIGALYLDQGLDACYNFIDSYIIAKAQRYIQEQRWIDPKSMLQQCCLTLRSVTTTSSGSGGSRKPDVPRYECLEEHGPANHREYKVAVYFRKEKLAEGVGRSIADAQANAAANALQFKSIFATQMDRTKQQIKLKIDRQLEQKKRDTNAAVRLDRHGNVMASSRHAGSSHSHQEQHQPNGRDSVDRHGQPRKRPRSRERSSSQYDRNVTSNGNGRDRHGNSRRMSPPSPQRRRITSPSSSRRSPPHKTNNGSHRPSQNGSAHSRRSPVARYDGSNRRRADDRGRSRSRSRRR